MLFKQKNYLLKQNIYSRGNPVK